MDRKAWLNKVTKELRNQNIAKMYFEDDMSSEAIRKEYPELTRQRIGKIARDFKNRYQVKENA